MVKAKALGISSLALAALLATAGTAGARTLTVNTFANEKVSGGACSLRDAVATVNQFPGGTTNWGCGLADGNADKIKLATGTYAITGDLVILKNVEVYGTGMSKTIIKSTAPDGLEIQGWPNKPVVKVRDLSLVGDGNCASCLGVYNDGRNALATLTLQRVQVSAFTRAGVHNDAGRMTLDHVRIGPNSNGAGPGGGIVNDGFTALEGTGMTIVRSLVISNRSTFSGGGIANRGWLTIDHSTISNNVSEGDGGGIASLEERYGGVTVPFMRLTHVTVAENFADGLGGGVFVAEAESQILTTNSIYAGNSTGSATHEEFSGRSGSSSMPGPNLFSHSEGVEQTKAADILNLSPSLGEIGSYGGLFQSHPLLRGSIAIDKAVGTSTSDQRDFFRPIDGNGDGTKTSDLGAYEHDPNAQTETAFIFSSSGDPHAVISNSGFACGKATRFSPDASTDQITYGVPLPIPGTYTMRIRVQKGPDRGRFQVQVRSDATGAFVNLGTVKDTYATTSVIGTLAIGDVTYSQEESKEVRILAVGKNSASTGRILVLDYIGLAPKTP